MSKTLKLQINGSKEGRKQEYTEQLQDVFWCTLLWISILRILLQRIKYSTVRNKFFSSVRKTGYLENCPDIKKQLNTCFLKYYFIFQSSSVVLGSLDYRS